MYDFWNKGFNSLSLMRKYSINLFIVLSLFCVTVFSMVEAEGSRREININEDWQFLKGQLALKDASKAFGQSQYQKINLPHTWNTDFLKGKGFYKGLGWYAKKINKNRSMKNKRLFLKFEGAMAVTVVYINGKEVGRHEGGYSAFVFEITDFLRMGENNILVSVDNSPQRYLIPGANILFPRYGGIYRPVWLLVTEKTCISPLDYAGPGVYLKQNSVTDESAEIEVITKISNQLKDKQNIVVKSTLFDAAGKAVNSESQTYKLLRQKTIKSTQKMTIKSPHLWNGRKDPYLYTVRVELFQKRILKDKLLDVVEQPLGLRYFHIDAQKGFILNGKPYDLHGVSRHQDWDLLGSALTYENHKTDVDLILEIGATAIRLAHYQQADDMYSLCDESGLIVWAEIPLIQGFNGFKVKNASNQLKELIKQNYNHPSLMFWGLANEAPVGFHIIESLDKLAKNEDPSRLTTIANNGSYTNRKATDLFGKNSYLGWYGGDLYKIDSYLDMIKERYPDTLMGISEYGAGGCVAHQEQNPVRPDPKGNYFPEQYQSLFHEVYWDAMSKRDYLWCKLIWNMFDFGWHGVDRGDRPNMNHKGLVTWDRKVKKDAFYFYKANWSDQPVLHITSKRHVDRDEEITDVKVYSNCQRVSLQVNGKSLSAKENSETTNSIFNWVEVKLKKGKNEIEVKGYRDGEIFKDKCVWKCD